MTADWLRRDMYIVSRDEVSQRPRSSLQVLLDPQGMFATLPLHPPPYAPNPAQLETVFAQFIRVLGLLPVGVGRQGFHVSVTGAAILACFLTCARILIPMARALAARHAIAVPEEFAAAARAHPRRRLSETAPGAPS